MIIMKDINVTFLEEYKRVDNYIRDAFGNGEGVSEYIREMEARQAEGVVRVATWKDDYKTLKHLRWVRNQLAHEVSIRADICDRSDVEWLRGFGKRLKGVRDPLAVVNAWEREVAKRAKRSYGSGQSGQSGQVVQSSQLGRSGQVGQSSARRSPAPWIPVEPIKKTSKRRRGNKAGCVVLVLLVTVAVVLALVLAYYLLK